MFSPNIFLRFLSLEGFVVHKPKSYLNPNTIASFYQSFCIRNYLTLIGSKKMLRTML